MNSIFLNVSFGTTYLINKKKYIFIIFELSFNIKKALSEE